MAARLKRVAVFGSTGSIGRAALDVVSRLPGRFAVHALAARSSTRTLYAQARRFGPKRIILADPAAVRRARSQTGIGSRVEWGIEPLIDVARSVDILVMAMTGTDGLLPVIAALDHRKRVAIATKELLVGYGEHIRRLARSRGADLLPIDSELAAVHQCLAGRPVSDVRRIVLTASGGPFWKRGLPVRPNLRRVLKHPTWQMGPKITVDSATMMNKGLELIEAARLFGLGPDRVEAVIHPQSIVHGLVEFVDGSVVGQLSRPDMRLPIQYCLCYPERVPSPVPTLDLTASGRLDFHPLRPDVFPCFSLAREALALGGTAPCVLNAANQVAVDAYLAGRIAFARIPRIIDAVLTDCIDRRKGAKRVPTIKKLLESERRATEIATRLADGRNEQEKGLL